jgi:hypothetical protein
MEQSPVSRSPTHAWLISRAAINISAFAERVVKLAEYRKNLRRYLIEKMNVVAPNLSALIGVDDSLGKRADVDQVDLVDVASHTGSGGVQDVSRSSLVVLEDLLQGGERLVGEGRTVTDGDGEETVLVGVGHELVQLGEVPSVPFSNSHGEGVQVLVELVGEGDGLLVLSRKSQGESDGP